MNITEIDLDTRPTSPPRKKRRPALACEQCRRRKIKCDRLNPCQQCAKANIEGCWYVQDSGEMSTTAPFEAQDIQFGVFEQMPRRPTAPPATVAPNTPFDRGNSNFSDSSSLVSFLEPDELRPAPALSPAIWPMSWDLELGGMLDDQISSAEPKVLPPAKSPPPGNCNQITNSSLQATFKPKPYRRSHWTHFAYQASEVLNVMQSHETEESKHGCSTFARCKGLARTIKMQERTAVQPNSFLRELIPTKVVADRLVQAYFRTFQTLFGILHVPSFRERYKAYWENSGSADKVFDTTLLVVMCIGSTFSLPEHGVSRATALQWIGVACVWTGSFEQKTKASMDGLRIQCLLVLARQIGSVSGDHAWLSTGSLMRMAMHMGLHIDPEAHSVPDMCASDIEARRRLWATIVELELQSSMDYGNVPGIGCDDYDFALPYNVDDANLEANRSAGSLLITKPMDQLTQSSIQILLAKTAPIRLKTAKLINDFRSKHSFEEVLSLSSTLLEALKTCSDLISSYCISSTPPTPFQTKMFDLLVQRFVLGLHQPFAVQAIANPSYYYSRKSGDDDFFHLRLSGKGFLRVVYAQSALYLCGELADHSQTGRAPSTNPGSTFMRKELHKAVDKYLELAVARLSCGGEKSIKCYVLTSCLLAQADAVQNGASMDQTVLKALRKALETSQSLLKSQLQGAPDRIHVN